MFICADCCKEMRCIKNGVFADYGCGHVYPGDLYQCSQCTREMLACTAGSCYMESEIDETNKVDMAGGDS